MVCPEMYVLGSLNSCSRPLAASGTLFVEMTHVLPNANQHLTASSWRPSYWCPYPSPSPRHRPSLSYHAAHIGMLAASLKRLHCLLRPSGLSWSLAPKFSCTLGSGSHPLGLLPVGRAAVPIYALCCMPRACSANHKGGRSG